MCWLVMQGNRGKVRDMDNIPGITARRLDLEKHVWLPEVNPGLVVVCGNTVFEGNRADMLKLVVEHVRDIIGDSLVFIPHEPCEAENSPGGSTSIKLCIESVPVRLGWGKDSDNVLDSCGEVLHLHVEILNHEQLHGKLGVCGVVEATYVVHVLLE